ncbi:unnamed protein product [Leuciscus chuanchicus]
MILMIHFMILLRPHSVTRPLQVTIGLPHPSKKKLVHTIRRVELVGFIYNTEKTEKQDGIHNGIRNFLFAQNIASTLSQTDYAELQLKLQAAQQVHELLPRQQTSCPKAIPRASPPSLV